MKTLSEQVDNFHKKLGELILTIGLGMILCGLKKMGISATVQINIESDENPVA